MTEASKSPRRPYEKSTRRRELAELLLNAGYEILVAEGMGLGASELTFKRVLDHIEQTEGRKINPGSVYDRLWIDVADYQADVLAMAADNSQQRSQEWHDTEEAIDGVLAAADTTTESGRAQFIKEIARVAGKRNADSIASSNHWPLWTAVWAMYTLDNGRTTGPGSESIRAGLRDSYEATTSHYRNQYEALMTLGQIAPRSDAIPEVDDAVLVFTRLLNALAEGVALRRRYEEAETTGFNLPTGPQAEDEEWDLFGIGAWAIVRGLFAHSESGDFLTSHQPR